MAKRGKGITGFVADKVTDVTITLIWGGGVISSIGTTVAGIWENVPLLALIPAAFGSFGIGALGIAFVIEAKRRVFPRTWVDPEKHAQMEAEHDRALGEVRRLEALQQQLIIKHALDLKASDGEEVQHLRSENGRLSKELDEAKSSKMPCLSGTIDQVAFGEFVAGHICGAPGVLGLTIRNSGKPSIAECWRVHFEMRNGNRVEAKIISIPPGGAHIYSTGIGPLKIVVPGQEDAQQYALTVTANQLLYRRALQKIDDGGLVRGYLPIEVFGVSRDDILSPGVKVVVSFTDVVQKEYSCSHTFGTHFGAISNFPID